MATLRASDSPPPISGILPQLVVNREGRPPVAIPDSLKLRGVNTPGYYRSGSTLNEEGRALRDRIDGDTIKRLDSLGCTVLARHSGWKTLLKGAVGTVELDALGVNYEGLIKAVGDTYGAPLQKESLILPSLGDGMVRCSDAVLINKIQGTGAPVFTTIDLLCVNPKACFERPCSSIYTQMLNKQIELERMLRDTYPERHPDAATNVDAIEHLKYPLANGIGQALHVVVLDPVCDPGAYSDLIDYINYRASKEEGILGSPVLKLVGHPRAPEGVSQDKLLGVMKEGHDGLFS